MHGRGPIETHAKHKADSIEMNTLHLPVEAAGKAVRVEA
jgi:hypothetical protein